MTALAEWTNFYVIVGSSAGALIGLQFVVMTLVAGRTVASEDAGRTFATPNIVHFSAVLFVAALLTAPWHAITAAAALLALVGVAGSTYALNIARRMRTRTAYQPVFEDWFFHCLLPLTAYVTLAISAFATSSHLSAALFGVGATTLALLLTGIHNTWDALIFHVFARTK
ncbi:MAG TPA: hypothetical protein VKU61_15130 [Candidatus Binatia bacterium]|nr:hypothetical protein [Candidatus Binatia bacterium]